MNEPLTEKYRPETWNDLCGNAVAVREIKNWAENWQRGDTPILLAGKPGVGKTSTANVIVEEMGWARNDINASSARTTSDIRDIADTIKSKPVSAEHQLVLLDEADSIPGQTKLKPLTDVLDDPPNPIIVVVNEKWETPNKITNRCKEYEFSLNNTHIQERLHDIVEKEDLDVRGTTISALSGRSNLRDAVMDLQRVCQMDAHMIDDDRDYEDNPYEVIEDLMRGNYDRLPRQFPEDPNDFVWWVDANLEGSGDMRGVELAVARDILSRADIYLQRVHDADGDYHQWKFVNELAKAVAAVRLTEPYDGYMNIERPNSMYKNPPNPNGNKSEAVLYRELSGEDGRFGLGCGFNEFLEIYMDFILDLSVEEQMQLALNEGLSEKAIGALDFDFEDYEDWLENEGHTREEQSVLDW